MAETLYAWSPIHTGKPNTDEKADVRGLREVIPAGSTVTQESTGLDDEQWAQLVNSGAVRTMKYPDMPDTYQSSPVQFLLEQARKAADDSLLAAETSDVNLAAVMQAQAAGSGVEVVHEEVDSDMNPKEPPVPTTQEQADANKEGNSQ